MGIGRLQPCVRVRSRVVSRLLQRNALVTSRSAAAAPSTSEVHPSGSRPTDTVEKTGCYTPVCTEAFKRCGVEILGTVNFTVSTKSQRADL